MANFKFLIAGLLLAFFGTAHASYAQLSHPVDWALIEGVKSAKISNNVTSFTGGFRSVNQATLNLSGKLVSIPAAYRFAANAGRFAAAAAFPHPAIFLALGAAAAYKYFTDQGLEVDAGIWKKKVTQVECPSGYFVYGGGCARVANRFTGLFVEIEKWLAGNTTNRTFIHTSTVVEGSCYRLNGTDDGYPISSVADCASPIGVVTKVAVDKGEFESIMSPIPIPMGVPQTWPLPDTWIPVEPKPIINPSADPVPVSQPMRIPLGDPVPIPSTDPQKWRNPVIDVVPSPTVDDPWRVDVQPKDIILDSPEPLPEYEPIPTGDPNAPPEQAVTPDLCASHPEILACADLDTPDSEELPTEDKSVSVSPDSGWGGNGSCPAPKHLTVQGRDIPIPLDIICQYMSGIRPIIIALAWLSAGFILIGARGGD
jgi:hypothetical protein